MPEAVRPDGDVGYRGDGDDPTHAGLRSWLDRLGLYDARIVDGKPGSRASG